jgi:hypothetical protein
MINPDQLYTVRQLQHQDLLIAAEIERAAQAHRRERAAAVWAWLASRLPRLSARHAARAPIARVGQGAKDIARA